MSKQLPPPELLRKLLRYDPDTGNLFWRERPVDMFSDGKYSAERACYTWNAKHSGQEAFKARSKFGYRSGCIFGRTHKSHRVIWAIHNGEWPSDDIDHINGVTGDNRIVNLRHVTRSDNLRNSSMPSDNTSGTIGVSWDRSRGRWKAYIKDGGKILHLGRFSEISMAIEARKAAEVEFGYHENHGR